MQWNRLHQETGGSMETVLMGEVSEEYLRRPQKDQFNRKKKSIKLPQYMPNLCVTKIVFKT